MQSQARILLGHCLCVLATATFAACADAPTRPPVLERVAADPKLSADPAVEARREEVEAALSREDEGAAIEEVEVRVRGDYDDDARLTVVTRVPVRNPSEVRANRTVREAETAVAIQGLEGALLTRNVDHCYLGMERAEYAERLEIYEWFSRRQQELLAWNRDWRRSGQLNELIAKRFEIESRVELATRMPGPPPPETGLPPLSVPAIQQPGDPLVTDRSVIEARVRAHPAVHRHRAESLRFQALVERARVRGRPWIDFFDLSYEPVNSSRADREYGAQVALRIPLGTERRADVARFEALRRSQEREAQAVAVEQIRRAQLALDALASFEERFEEWNHLTKLAREADALAQQWWRKRLAEPSAVEALTDKVFDARRAVLDARVEAGFASCVLLETTGVPHDRWPRRPVGKP